MTQTKEQLISEVAKLKQSHEGWVAGDERRRKEFAKAFNWNKTGQRYYDGEPNPHSPSWEEIFVEIGRLLAAQRGLQYVSDVENLKLNIQEMKNEIKNHLLKHEN